ncbi:MAG: SPOR domain-containing protein [Myxococcales bacterium]|nr:SPOR domain-containing protein [Myxococcales bacterium]
MATEARGLLPTALGLLVLGGGGFGVGLLAGGFWEEPDLVARYLLGGTESVDLSASAGGSSDEALAPVAAAPKDPLTGPARAVAKPTPGVPATRPSAPPTVAAAPPAGRAAVQVGAFGESQVAERLAARLRAKGYEVYLSPGAATGDARWRVRVGPIASRAEAQRTAGRLKTEEKLPTWVLTEDHGR